MKRNLLLLSILLMMALALTACAPAAQTEAAPEETSQPGEATEMSAAAQLVAAQDAAFLEAVLPVNENLESFLGEEVTLSGYVLYRDSFEGDDFMVARLVVDCCIDDAAATGFVTQWEGEAPAADEWVTVTGVIDQRDVYDETTGMTFIHPYLLASSVEIIEPFESEYLFTTPYE